MFLTLEGASGPAKPEPLRVRSLINALKSKKKEQITKDERISGTVSFSCLDTDKYKTYMHNNHTYNNVFVNFSVILKPMLSLLFFEFLPSAQPGPGAKTIAAGES